MCDSLTNADISAYWQETVAFLRDMKIVSLFLRHSPLFRAPVLPERTGLVISGHPTRLVHVQDVHSVFEQNGRWMPDQHS